MQASRETFSFPNLGKMNRLTIIFLTIMMIILHQTVLVQSYTMHNQAPLRHYNAQHRFPHLQRVQTRLDSPHHLATSEVASRAVLRSGLEYSKSAEDDYDDDEDVFDDDDEEDEDDIEEDSLKDHQSYQPHSEGGRPPWETESSHHDNTPAMSPHSQFKWTTFGHRPAIDEYRNRLVPGKKRPQTQSVDDTQEAIQHALRVNRETICKVPRPKVIHVKDVYPHPSKSYVPHCTILHQCGDDTGCCKTDTHACVARRTHRVELYFWSTTHAMSSAPDLGSRYRQSYTGSSVVEKLVFYNHTECACEDKHVDLMPRDMEPQRSHIMAAETHFRPSHTRMHETPTPRSSGCRCPGDFSPRLLDDGSCKCECFDKQRDCLRLKRGKDYFTHQDRLCIEKKQCQLPVCEFGSYMKLSGRCMRKQEKFATWQGYSPRHDFR